MAKRKKPVSIFNLPKEEVAKASSKIIRQTSKEERPAPKKEVTPPKPKTTPKKPSVRVRKSTPAKPKKPQLPPQPKKAATSGKRKFLYVDEGTHLQAKINAAMRGMKLQEYIAWLIANDQVK